MSNTFAAIQNLYPNVVTVKTTPEGIVSAYDESMGSIVIDMDEVEVEIQRLEAEVVAAEEAKAAATAETEAKLEALGLTKEDLAALLGQ